MNLLVTLAGRIPRVLLYALAGAIQVVLIAAMVYDRVRVLREGSEVALLTRPVDPRDFLRGDYVVLNYEIGDVPAGALKDTPSRGRGTPVFVKLVRKDGGVYAAVSAHGEPVPLGDGEVLIRGRTESGATCGSNRRAFCDRLRVTYGIERYFVPQDEGKEIERSRNQGKVSIVAAVTPAGRAAIKRLLIDGKPVYDEPMF
ncbi:MAG: GDYXXLXY domain-containing protein [Xanthobacteraceae bacterium]|nr:GDYXXLXY domain-containing protein [Xanthobacteraceae bacterium]